MKINELVEQAHSMAKNKGFWDDGFNFGEKIALIHSELSEALEHFRDKGDDPYHIYEVNGKPEGLAVELADVAIRLADLCGYLNVDLEGVIKLKMKYNLTRPHKHNRKF